MMNISINGSFENGWIDYNESIQIPAGWLARWADVDTPNPYSSDPWNQFVAPEIVHKLRHQLPEDERDLFVLDGYAALKCFKGYGAFCLELTHPLILEPGVYTFTVRVFGDLVAYYDNGRKHWAADPNSGLLRFVLNGHAYEDTHIITPAMWNLYSMEFAADGDTSIGVQVMCPFALQNSGVWCDAWTLVKSPSEGQCRGAPREEYQRIYYVFPGNARWKDYKTTIRDLFIQRRTMGFSWDDAGIGDLDSRTAALIDAPMKDIAVDWFGEHYPEVDVQFIQVEVDPPPPPPPVSGELLSIHLQTEVDGWLGYVRDVKPRWVKLVGNMELARQIKSVSPATKVLFRHHIQHNDPYLNAPNKTQAAREFLALFWDSLVANAAYIDAIEGLNETIATHDIDGIRKAVSFEVALSDELARRNIGVGTCLLNTATANPEHGIETEMLLPAAAAAVRNDDWIGQHPYFPCTPVHATHWMETEWLHHHGRALASWDVSFAKFNVTPRYLFTEGGAVGATVRPDGRPGALNANAGWRYSGCLNGDLDAYITLLLRFREKVAEWNATHDNRAETLAIFTTGGAYVGWPDFLFNTNELQALEAALGYS